jgi:hypothetical protein
MPGKLLIELSETDYGFVAAIPGSSQRGFGPTIPGAPRRLGASLVEATATLPNGYRVQYRQLMAELCLRQEQDRGNQQ